jgi:hypothetical protein
MKQEYKDMMMKYLNDHPQIEITSNPIGWYRNLEEIGGQPFDDKLSPLQLVSRGKIEHAMISLFLRDKTPSCTSYKFKYDKEQKAFIGKLKKRSVVRRLVNVEVKVPNDIWFNTIDVEVDLKGKNSVECSVKMNLRNGMMPPNVVDVEKAIENTIERQFREQLKGKGRVSQTRIRETFNYSNVLSMDKKCDIIIHNNEDFTIKL